MQAFRNVKVHGGVVSYAVLLWLCFVHEECNVLESWWLSLTAKNTPNHPFTPLSLLYLSQYDLIRHIPCCIIIIVIIAPRRETDGNGVQFRGLGEMFSRRIGIDRTPTSR